MGVPRAACRTNLSADHRANLTNFELEPPRGLTCAAAAAWAMGGVSLLTVDQKAEQTAQLVAARLLHRLSGRRRAPNALRVLLEGRRGADVAFVEAACGRLHSFQDEPGVDFVHLRLLLLLLLISVRGIRACFHAPPELAGPTLVEQLAR